MIGTILFYFEGFHSFDNSYCKEMRYKKTHAGEKKFKMVVQDKSLTYQDVADQLLRMLNNKTQYVNLSIVNSTCNCIVD